MSFKIIKDNRLHLFEKKDKYDESNTRTKEQMVNDCKHIEEPDYMLKGLKFRSWLETRWAKFFELCGADWEYENYSSEMTGDSIKTRLRYLPDFKIKNVHGRYRGTLFVEVKGGMSDYDAKKIRAFIHSKPNPEDGIDSTALLILGDIPIGDNFKEIMKDMEEQSKKKSKYPHCFSFETINGDPLTAYPGINKKGEFELFGDDFADLRYMDKAKTEAAYRTALNYRYQPKK